MGAQEFGQLVEAERQKRGWTRSKLAVSVGVLDDGSALDATQIRRIVEGTRKLNRDVIERLIDALGLDRAEAWEAALESADLKPPGLTADMLRRLHLVASDDSALAATSANGVIARKVGILPVEQGLGELIRRNRPQLVLAGGTRAGSYGSGQYGPVGPTASLAPLRLIRPAGEATPLHAPHSSEAILRYSTWAPYPGARAYPKLRPPQPRVDRRQRDRRRLRLVPEKVAA